MSDHSIGLVLGGGGAAGLAHIPVLQAFDDLGVKPAHIAATSVGALIGCAYAAGHDGSALEVHFRRLGAQPLRQIMQLVRRGGIGVRGGIGTLDAVHFARALLPPDCPERLELLPIPVSFAAVDLHKRALVSLTQGPLVNAVAASLAVPAVFRPVAHEGRVLIDGGVIDNLPLGFLPEGFKIVASNVLTDPPVEEIGLPGRLHTSVTALRMMMINQAQTALAHRPPEILVTAELSPRGIGGLWETGKILDQASPLRTRARDQLAALLSA
jgi:NTE family protein